MYEGKTLGHSPSIPDIPTSGFHLCGLPRIHLVDQHFRNNAGVQQAVLSWFHTLGTDFYDAGFEDLVY
ncbi:hypothetical protein TNCV_3435141 [Trichonephila clavipes]|nr:hypothetical protein TNCV_3435141 [Trichonephila clavipes]